MSVKIAINSMVIEGKIPAGDYRWKNFNDSFVNQDWEALDIINAVYTGHSYAAWHSGRRCVDNFVCAQHIAVDLETHDQRSTIDYIAKMDFVRMYGGFIYTTPSHTDTDPRARVVFFLDAPITDAVAYKSAIGFVYSLFPGSDASCVDASRFFYGSKNCQLEWINSVLPVRHLRRYFGMHKAEPVEQARPVPVKVNTTKAAAKQDQTATNKEPSADTYLQYAITDAAAQGRNERGFRLACQLKELGISKFDAETYMRRYQQAVERTKTHNYSEHEAMISLNSAYARAH